MTRYALIAGAALLSTPLMAQTGPTQPVQTPPASTDTTVTTPTPATPPASTGAPTSLRSSTTSPTSTPPATTAQPAQPAQTPAGAQPAQPAGIAQIVETEFPSYDKDASGTLNRAEFASWMVALRKASEPTLNADSPETATWVGQAFASADKDQNSAVTKTELTGFLSQGQS